MSKIMLYGFLDLPEVQKIGVYAIHNKTNDKYYIGSSTNIYQRLIEHNYNGTNMQMIKDRFIYMPAEWEIIILKTFEDGSINSSELIQWENYYIKEYDSINNGYNRRIAYDTEKNKDLLYCRHIKPRKNKVAQQWEYTTLLFPKGTKDRIKAAGVGSVNGYINKLVADDLNRREGGGAVFDNDLPFN